MALSPPIRVFIKCASPAEVSGCGKGVGGTVQRGGGGGGGQQLGTRAT